MGSLKRQGNVLMMKTKQSNSNLKLCYQQCKKALKTPQEVVKIHEDIKSKGGSSLASLWRMGSTSIKGCDAFESYMPFLVEFMAVFIDANINMIGAYGMRGVGKSYVSERRC